MTNIERAKLIQRWIGVPDDGDLNNERTISELIKDLPGLQAYFIEKYSEREGINPKRKAHITSNKGGSFSPRGILFHHSGGSASGTISWIKNPRSRVSYHYLIDLEGTIHQFVDPVGERAWHAGRSSFKGIDGCNGFLIGIAFEGDTNHRQLTPLELATADFLVREISMNLFSNLLDYDWITSHHIVSPGRKTDLSNAAWESLKEYLDNLK